MSTAPPQPPNSETRRKKRFAFETPLAASFATLPIELIDISITGAQVLHTGPLAVAKEGTLTVTPPGGAVTAIRARVRWSRLHGKREDGMLLYRSGLAIDEESVQPVFALIEQLVRTKKVRYDTESLRRKQESAAAKKQTVKMITREPARSSTQDIDEVRKARVYLRSHPEESMKWMNRARFSFAKEKSGQPLEQIAVWEFLGRKVELSLIELAFRLTR